MSSYLKLDFNTPSRTNSALEQAITYIGKTNGKLAHKEGYTNKQYLNAGIVFIAKKFGKFRKNAIKYMIFSKKMKNSANKQWRFNKQIYGRAYHVIVSLLLNAPSEDKKFIHDLLLRLYNETLSVDSDSAKICSNALVFWQKRMLQINSMHNDSDIAEHSIRIYHSINENDKPLL